MSFDTMFKMIFVLRSALQSRNTQIRISALPFQSLCIEVVVSYFIKSNMSYLGKCPVRSIVVVSQYLSEGTLSGAL
jgi:hypothetical protein